MVQLKHALKKALYEEMFPLEAKLLKHGPIVSNGINVYLEQRVTLIKTTKIRKKLVKYVTLERLFSF